MCNRKDILQQLANLDHLANGRYVEPLPTGKEREEIDREAAAYIVQAKQRRKHQHKAD